MPGEAAQKISAKSVFETSAIARAEIVSRWPVDFWAMAWFGTPSIARRGKVKPNRAEQCSAFRLRANHATAGFCLTSGGISLGWRHNLFRASETSFRHTSHMTTRRKFLFDCSTALAAFALVPVSSFGAGNFQSIAEMSHAALAAQVNTFFRVRLASGQMVKLKLLKAPLARPTPSRLGRRSGDAGNEKFSLVFSGPKAALLAAAIHEFEHERLGRFEMYIGQIGTQDAESVRYESVFNRPAPAKLT
jgi:hypothetical protein